MIFHIWVSQRCLINTNLVNFDSIKNYTKSLDCTPSDAGLQVIVVELCEHWRELALSLGIPNNDIEACERTQAGTLLPYGL